MVVNRYTNINYLKYLYTLTFLILLGTLHSSAYKLNIYNPNSYDLINYQMKINISNYSSLLNPYLDITDSNNNTVPFCFEQSNGECSTNPSNILWLKLNIPANSQISLIIKNSNINKAINGDQVFDFYDDFKSTSLDTSKWNQLGTTFTLDGDNLVGDGGNIVSWVESIYSVQDKSIVEFRMKPSNSGDFDSGIKVGNIYFLVEVGSGNPIISNSFSYPGGKQTLNYQIYSAIIKSGNLKLIDHYNNYVVSSTLTYSSGQITLLGDSDSTSRKTIYDWIRVRKYADQEPIYNFTKIYNVYFSFINPKCAIERDGFFREEADCQDLSVNKLIVYNPQDDIYMEIINPLEPTSPKNVLIKLNKISEGVGYVSFVAAIENLSFDKAIVHVPVVTDANKQLLDVTKNGAPYTVPKYYMTFEFNETDPIYKLRIKKENLFDKIIKVLLSIFNFN